MALEKTGLQAVIEGMGGFRSSAGEINKTYDRLSTGSERAAGRMSRMGDIAKTAIGFAVGTVAVSAVKSLTSGLGDLVTSAAPLVDMEASFDRLAKTYEIDSGLMMEAMRNAAKGTIADSSLIESANKALIGSGQELGKEFGESLPKLLEMARASAKATGQDVGFLFESLVLGIKRSSPLIIDNTGLQLKVGAATEKYAAALGITVEEMTAEQKQIALLNATLEAGAGMVEAMGDEQLTTAERMAQLRATTQNLKDEIGKALLPVLQGFLNLILPIAQKLSGVLVPAIEKAVGWITGMADTIGSLWDAFAVFQEWGLDAAIEQIGETLWAAFGPGVGRLFYDIADAVRPAIVLFQDLWGAVGAFREWGLDAAIEQIGETLWETFGPETGRLFYDMVERVREFGAGILETFSQVWPLIKTVAQDAFAGVIEGVQWFMGIIRTNFETLLPPLIDLFATIVGKIPIVAQTVVGWFEENWPRIQAIFATVWTAIQSIVDFVLPYVRDIIVSAFAFVKGWVDENWPLIQSTITTILDIILAAVERVLGLIRQFWEAHGVRIIRMVWDAYEVIKQTVLTALDAVLGIVKVAMLLIHQDWEGAWLEIQRIARVVWETIQEITRFAMDTICSLFEMVLPTLQTLWQNAWEWIKEASGKAWEWIKEASSAAMTYLKLLVGLGMESIKGTIGRAWEWIVRAVGVAWERVKQASASAMTSIKLLFGQGWESVKNTVGRAWESIKGLVRQGIEAAKDAIRGGFGAFSDLGRQLIEALVRGVRQAAGRVAAAATEVVRAAIDAAKRALHIGSPSRVFLEMGENITVGMAEGILKQLPGLQDTMRKMASDLTVQARTSLTQVPAAAMVSPVTAGASYNRSYSQTFNFQANYGETQSPVTLKQDLEAMMIRYRMG